MKRWDEVKGKYASKLASIITGTSTSTSKNSDRGNSSNSNGSKDEQFQNFLNASVSAPAATKAVERPERAREAKITKKLLIQESDSEEEEFGAVPKKQKIATSPVYSRSSSGRPKPIESVFSVPVPVPQVPSSPVLSVQLDKDMDDKTALSAALQAAWEFLSVADVDSTFAVAVSPLLRCIILFHFIAYHIIAFHFVSFPCYSCFLLSG